MTTSAVDIAKRHINIEVLPGHNSPFGPSTARWDGRMLDEIYQDAGITTVSYRDTSTALAVLQRNGKVRKRGARAGDVVFLAENNYVGIILEVRSKTEIQALVGWLPGTQGKRRSRVVRLDLPIHVLAVADPHIPIKQRVARPALTANDRKEIANLLSQHPAVGTFVPPQHFESAYARWQRYLGYEDKATGQVDEKSLTRLAEEMER